MIVEVLRITENCEELIEQAARLCYDSKGGDSKSTENLFNYLIEKQHTSVFEHASITFKVSDVSRVLSHQLVRHRVGVSYSQRSQRYIDAREFGIVIPLSIYENEEGLKLYRDLMDNCGGVYKKLKELGVKKEDARFVLPNACTTGLIVTYNFTSLRHFLDLRLDPSAQWEIRNLAKLFFYYAYEAAPKVFGDFKILYPELFDVVVVCPYCGKRGIMRVKEVDFIKEHTCVECSKVNTYSSNLRNFV